MLWDYNKKEKSNNYISDWQTSFYITDLKGKHFLNLINNNLEPIVLMYIKEGSWLKYIVITVCPHMHNKLLI